MSKTRNLSDLLDANGDVKTDALDNVPPSNDASALTTGTLDSARLGTITNFTSTGIDDNATSTAVTIDSNEKVLVGMTVSSGDSDGIQLVQDGRIFSTVDGQLSTILNRKTSDGGIVEFRKDGSTVGEIGTKNSLVYIGSGSGNSGIRFTSTALFPVDGGDGTTSGGNFDLGGSGVKWKDLYLSGNIYLGGTGSANALDDYEEGTWTPTVLNGWGILNPTYSTNTGYYTKIGNLVYVLFKIVLSGGSTNGNPLVIHGLPYNSNATPGGSGIYDTLHGSFSTASSNATNVFMKVGSNNTSNAQAFYKTSSGEANFTGTNAGGSFNCTFSGIYRTDS